MDRGFVHTCNRGVVRAIDCWSASIVTNGVQNILSISSDIEFQRSRCNIVGVVGIEPGAPWDILTPAISIVIALVVFKSSSPLNTVVPCLATGATDITGPSTTTSTIELLNSDPRDACCIVIVRDTDVLGSTTRDRLVYGLGADTAGLDFAATRLTRVPVTLVECINMVDRTTLVQVRTASIENLNCSKTHKVIAIVTQLGKAGFDVYGSTLGFRARPVVLEKTDRTQDSAENAYGVDDSCCHDEASE